jgi:Fic family protein
MRARKPESALPIRFAAVEARADRARSRTRRSHSFRAAIGLAEVREHGAWEPWLEFFLEGVAVTANQAFDAAIRIVDLFKRDREQIRAQSERAVSPLMVHEHFQKHPFLTVNQLVERTGLSAPTINTVLVDLEKVGIVGEVTGRKRGRVFCYSGYLAILDEGTEPLPAALLGDGKTAS